VGTEKYDLDGKPDGEGQPNEVQWKTMIQKLLAERFQLTFHHEKKELYVYALVVAKSGPKIMKSDGNPNGPPSLLFPGIGKLASEKCDHGGFCERDAESSSGSAGGGSDAAGRTLQFRIELDTR
jgi:hypothetical protein